MASNPELPPSELPPFHQTFLPILRELSDGAVKDRNAIQSAVQERHYAHLPEELLQERTSTGSNRNRLLDRIRLGISYLSMAGYLEKPNRGQYRIVAKGRDALRAGQLSLAELKEQPEFRAYDRPGYFINKARDAEQEGALEAAIEWYSKAIELNPSDADSYVNRGLAKAKLNEYAAAIDDYDRAIDLNPNYAGAYYNRGLAKAKLEEYAGAIADYDRAIELNPSDADSYVDRGNAKAKLNEYEAAIADFDRAIELNPNYDGAYYNRGNAKAMLNEYEAAIDDYDRAIDLNPNHANAYMNRGNAKAGLRKYKAAIADYSEAIDLNPLDSEAYMFRGIAKAKRKQNIDALADYDQAIELNPDFADAYYNRGITKFELKRFAAAISDYDRAIELKPDSPERALSYYNRGVTYRVLGQEDKAIQDFKQAQDLDPTVISKEGMKPLEKDVESIGKKTESVEDFQDALSVLEKEFLTDKEEFLFKSSVRIVCITIVVFLVFIILEYLESSEYLFWRVSSLMAFLVALTFYILGQHNKVTNLRIDAHNRLAMAKLLACIEREHEKSGERDWHDRAYASLIDAIVYRIEFKKPKAAGESMVQRVIDGVSDGLSKKG